MGLLGTFNRLPNLGTAVSIAMLCCHHDTLGTSVIQDDCMQRTDTGSHREGSQMDIQEGTGKIQSQATSELP